MPKTDWITDVRSVLKREHGKGWLIEKQSGRIKICLALPGQRRQAITTHLSWAPSSATKLTTLVGEIRDRMESLKLGLAESYRLLVDVPEGAVQGQLDWVEVANRYEQWRVGTGDVVQTTYDRDERPHINNALKLLSLPKRAPHDGRSLMTSYALKFFANCAPGGAGRKRHLLSVERFLGFAVKRCGAAQQWLPPEKADIDELIGSRELAVEKTVPIKPEQLHSLLVSLDSKPEVRLAVALVGLYGLRPSELQTLSVEEGDLYVAPTKRNKATAKTPRKPRLVLPLDLVELPGEGTRCVQLWESGLVKLPTSIVNAKGFKAAGNAFATCLARHDYWNSLKANTEGLVPYSLRHGYAWRAVKYEHYDKAVPLRDLCDLMGHDSRTHLKHYGPWTSDKDKKDSVKRAVGQLSATNSLAMINPS